MGKTCGSVEHQPLGADEQKLAGDVLELLTGNWTFWTLHVLDEATGPMRFSHMMDALDGVSQKVLMRTLLSQLERDGFVTRTVFAKVPPRMDYALTDFGGQVPERMAPLLEWVVARVDAFAAAKARFAERQT